MIGTPNTIANPFGRGQAVVLPAGTLVRSMNPRHDGIRVTARRAVVAIKTAHAGYVETDNYTGNGRGFVHLPSITYLGAGGYWQDVQVTEELCAANNVEMPALPAYTERELAFLDVAPSYGPGYDDRHKVEVEA